MDNRYEMPAWTASLSNRAQLSSAEVARIIKTSNSNIGNFLKDRGVVGFPNRNTTRYAVLDIRTLINDMNEGVVKGLNVNGLQFNNIKIIAPLDAPTDGSLITIAEAAKFLKITPETIRNHGKKGYMSVCMINSTIYLYRNEMKKYKASIDGGFIGRRRGER